MVEGLHGDAYINMTALFMHELLLAGKWISNTPVSTTCRALPDIFGHMRSVSDILSITWLYLFLCCLSCFVYNGLLYFWEDWSVLDNITPFLGVDIAHSFENAIMLLCHFHFSAACFFSFINQQKAIPQFDSLPLYIWNMQMKSSSLMECFN